MAIEGDVNAASTTNVRSDGGKKNRKGKKHQKSHEEMLLDPTPSEALTSHPPSTTEASDDELRRRPLTSPQEKSGSQGLKWRGRPWRY
ncbi:hypothetical protein H5410_036716 [Solanum commersonii]|uniref:Uncharacterized protein n=1 Tax=Solanum commersonii TaxID=4109 RepID=A0A9J5Y877_SOLCO|nr:hypothetical protein H5410_036716 [Solanum commersonii]